MASAIPLTKSTPFETGGLDALRGNVMGNDRKNPVDGATGVRYREPADRERYWAVDRLPLGEPTIGVPSGKGRAATRSCNP